MPDIYRELCNLAGSDMYPFHMPGHKRNEQSTPLKGAFRCDITEIDGFDNLHDESGIILEAEERASRLYGSDSTFFLINGSTSGVLSAVSAALPRGGKILAARGSHRSFYHAAYLRMLDIEYLPYREYGEYRIPDVYTAGDVEERLSDDIQAVFITSPTYEGRSSDVRGIAEVCHKHGIPLIVDAAHGAHFGLSGELPENAVSQGADIVIHSLHKTLPAMTQTALLHVKSKIVDTQNVKRFLRIYQSSSPSYIMMASIDLCIEEMEKRGDEFAKNLVKYRDEIEQGIGKCSNIKVAGKRDIEDPSKVLIFARNGSMTGKQLYDILREEYALQLEMAGEKYALAIISGWDTQEGIDRLIKAICEIDAKANTETSQNADDGKETSICKADHIPQKEMRLFEAWDADKEYVPLDEAQGRVAGDFINLYPPGIPLIVPGEVIDRDLIGRVHGFFDQNLNVQGVIDGEKSENKGIIFNRKEVLCVRQK